MMAERIFEVISDKFKNTFYFESKCLKIKIMVDALHQKYCSMMHN
jgi:hypothetical protein